MLRCVRQGSSLTYYKYSLVKGHRITDESQLADIKDMRLVWCTRDLSISDGAGVLLVLSSRG